MSHGCAACREWEEFKGRTSATGFLYLVAHAASVHDDIGGHEWVASTLGTIRVAAFGAFMDECEDAMQARDLVASFTVARGREEVHLYDAVQRVVTAYDLALLDHMRPSISDVARVVLEQATVECATDDVWGVYVAARDLTYLRAGTHVVEDELMCMVQAAMYLNAHYGGISAPSSPPIHFGGGPHEEQVPAALGALNTALDGLTEQKAASFKQFASGYLPGHPAPSWRENPHWRLYVAARVFGEHPHNHHEKNQAAAIGRLRLDALRVIMCYGEARELQAAEIERHIPKDEIGIAEAVANVRHAYDALRGEMCVPLWVTEAFARRS